MLFALSTIANEQSKAITNIQKAVNWLLDYAASNPDTRIRFVSSNITLWMYSNAFYLSKPAAKTWAGAAFFLWQKLADQT